MRLRSASRWRPAEPQIRDFDRRSEYGHTSRFPATHPLGEKHPADYARHEVRGRGPIAARAGRDRKSTRLNSSHVSISYAVFCLKKKKNNTNTNATNYQ